MPTTSVSCLTQRTWYTSAAPPDRNSKRESQNTDCRSIAFATPTGDFFKRATCGPERLLTQSSKRKNAGRDDGGRRISVQALFKPALLERLIDLLVDATSNLIDAEA